MKRGLVVVVAAALVVVGCAPTAPPADDVSGTVTVFAAASLTESFDAIAAEFEDENPDATVVLNYGGSSSLATQITEGAPVDVFAAASETAMSSIGAAAEAPVVFVTNTLEIAVPAGNPGNVAALVDLARDDLAIAVCDAAVPCGAAAASVLADAGVVASVDTYEQDVKAVLTKVELGEVDAGLVYRTDVLAAGDAVEGIPFAEAAGSVTAYPIAALRDAPNPVAAAAFVEFVLGPTGKGVLADAGFGNP